MQTIKITDNSVDNIILIDEMPQKTVIDLIDGTPGGYISHRVGTQLDINFIDFHYTNHGYGGDNLSGNLNETPWWDASNGTSFLRTYDKNKFGILIPKDLFYDANNERYNYGKFLFRLSPKSIFLEVTSSAYNPDKIIGVDKNALINYSPWMDNENDRFSLLNSKINAYQMQDGEKKKLLLSDTLFSISLGSSEATLTLGYGSYPTAANRSKLKTISVGDYIEIIPRETAFDDIYFLVEFNKNTDEISQIRQYIINDVVRNIETGVFEIYDDDGVIIDGNGNIDGKVIRSFQISKINENEVRKEI